MLDAAVGGVGNAHRIQTAANGGLDGIHKGLILLLMGLQVGHNGIVFIGGQIPQRDIFQLPLDLLHTKPVRQRSIDIHGLPAF